MFLIRSNEIRDVITNFLFRQSLIFVTEEKDNGITGTYVQDFIPALFKPIGGKQMSELCIMNETGDTRITWFPDDEGEIKKAKKKFDELKSKGWSFFTVEAITGKGKKVTSFDSSLSQIIAVPPIAGG